MPWFSFDQYDEPTGIRSVLAHQPYYHAPNEGARGYPVAAPRIGERLVRTPWTH